MRVLYVQYSDPAAFPPVLHSTQILADHGVEVLVLGVTGEATRALGAGLPARVEFRSMKTAEPGVLQKLHYLTFHIWVLWTLWRWRADWLYISDALATPVGWMGVFVRGGVVYHEHDAPYEARPGAPAPSLFMWTILAARRHCARIANVCVLPNENRIAWFRETTETASPVVCVWNCPSLTELAVVQPKQIERTELILFFTDRSFQSVCRRQ